jgi:Na+-transporting methylmalonyl-CoA/oxaloacetate decarboxylase gamma subunit
LICAIWIFEIPNTQEAMMENVSWSAALEVFGIGFGGVFTCLLVLLFAIALFSRIAARFDKQPPEAPDDRR